MNKIDAYAEIYKTLNKCAKHTGNYLIGNMLSTVKDMLEKKKLFDSFGLDDHSFDSASGRGDYYRISDYESICFFHANTNSGARGISLPDDGRQPENEWLYFIRFSEGAYFFGDHYPTETFNSFFDELKTFNPKFVDTTNHCVYFDSAEAPKIKKELRSIIDKYKVISRDEHNKKKIDDLEKELARLKG